MSTDISIEPNAPHPPHPEIDLELVVEGAPSSAAVAEGGNFEVGVEGGTISHPRRFRGPDKNENSALLRHVTHCSICNHPDRDAIEQAILHWYSPTVIVHEFDLADRHIVYRHAEAFGLFRLRAEQSRHALGFLIEQAQSIVPSADAIIRAVRALSCIDDHGHWHEPRKEVIITHRYEEAGGPAEQENPDRVETPVQQPRRLASARSSGPARPGRSECAGRAGRATRRRGRGRSLGGRSFSSDKKSAPSSGVLTPEASEPVETPRRSWSPLRLFSTRLLRKDPPNSSNINKTAKTSRHTFAEFDDAENRTAAPAVS